MSPVLQEDSLPTEPAVKPNRSQSVGSGVESTLSIEEQDPLEKGTAWQPTPVFLPVESHGWRSLVGYTFHGVAKESDMT